MTPSNVLSWSRYRRLPSRRPPYSLQNHTPCPLCGAVQEEEIHCIEDFQFFEDRDGTNRVTHRIVVCRHCGAMYRNPWYTPEGMAFLFEKAGKSYGQGDGGERVRWLTDRGLKTGKVLDIGCGDGSFLRAFPPGFQCVGIDRDALLIQRARERSPEITFYLADDADPVDPPQADWITMFHILEHLPAPLDTLRRLRRGAKPTSRLVVEVPVIDCAQRIQGNDLCGFFSLPHLTHFSKRTLRCMFQFSGWEVVDEEDMPGYNGHRVVARAVAPVARETLDLSQGREGDRALTTAYLRKREQSVQRIRDRVAAIPAGRSILIWGAGHHTEYLERFTDLFRGDRDYLIVDSDPLKTGTQIHGIPVLSPGTLDAEFWRSGTFHVVVSSFYCEWEIRESLAALGVAPDHITTLYG